MRSIFKDQEFINAIFSDWLSQINSAGEDSLSAIGGLQYLLQCIYQSLATLSFTLRVDDAPTWSKSELIE